MSEILEDLKSKVLSLDEAQRAALAATLLESLEHVSDAQWDTEWAAEAARRRESARSGHSALSDGAETMSELRPRLS